MSARLETGTTTSAGIDRVWDVLVDWVGQARWIPLTTLQVLTPHQTGLGVRIAALSGFWLGRWPLGLLDNFVVTGWSPPADGQAELEILHLGPYFTGEGVFHLSTVQPGTGGPGTGGAGTGGGGGTTVECVELVTVPGGPLTNALVGLTLPLMKLGFDQSLAQFAAVAEGRRG